MKTIKYLASALVLTAGMTLVSCNGNKTAAAADSDSMATETVAEATDSLNAPSEMARIFTDPAKKSETPTDTTYAETPTGLKYMVLKEGTGDRPSADDTVTVHYTGELLNGQVFDSSVSRGEPASFPLNRVIPGWTEGMKLVGKGGAITLWIPADLAYGPRGAGRDIGPNEALQFEVEIVDVKPYVEPAPVAEESDEAEVSVEE